MICIYVCMHVCVYVCMYVYTYVRTCMHTYIHTYIHTYVHTLSHVFIFVVISRSYIVGRSRTFDVSRVPVSRNRFSHKRNAKMGRVVPANIFLPKKKI
jgi:hypothetical protein